MKVFQINYEVSHPGSPEDVYISTDWITAVSKEEARAKLCNRLDKESLIYDFTSADVI